MKYYYKFNLTVTTFSQRLVGNFIFNFHIKVLCTQNETACNTENKIYIDTYIHFCIYVYYYILFCLCMV